MGRGDSLLPWRQGALPKLGDMQAADEGRRPSDSGIRPHGVNSLYVYWKGASERTTPFPPRLPNSDRSHALSSQAKIAHTRSHGETQTEQTDTHTSTHARARTCEHHACVPLTVAMSAALATSAKLVLPAVFLCSVLTERPHARCATAATEEPETNSPRPYSRFYKSARRPKWPSAIAGEASECKALSA